MDHAARMPDHAFINMPSMVLTMPGDANYDGKVDINDLTIVLAHYNQSGATWAQGDFTGDGKVDINDLTIVLAHYDQSVGSSAAATAAVPEPATIAIAAAALAGCGPMGGEDSGRDLPRRADGEGLEPDPDLALVADFDRQRVHVARAGRLGLGALAGEVETGRVAGAEETAAAGRGLEIDRAAGMRANHLKRQDLRRRCVQEDRADRLGRKMGPGVRMAGMTGNFLGVPSSGTMSSEASGRNARRCGSSAAAD